MEPAAAHTEDESKLIDAALAAGLRALDVRVLTDDGDAPLGTVELRLRFVTLCALTVGVLRPVYVPASYFGRVARLLAQPDGELALERVARFVATGTALNA